MKHVNANANASNGHCLTILHLGIHFFAAGKWYKTNTQKMESNGREWKGKEMMGPQMDYSYENRLVRAKSFQPCLHFLSIILTATSEGCYELVMA